MQTLEDNARVHLDMKDGEGGRVLNAGLRRIRYSQTAEQI